MKGSAKPSPPVIMVHGCLLHMYLGPGNERSFEQGKIVVMLYIFMSPMLNLFIYSPRSKDVKQTLRRLC